MVRTGIYGGSDRDNSALNWFYPALSRPDPHKHPYHHISFDSPKKTNRMLYSLYNLISSVARKKINFAVDVSLKVSFNLKSVLTITDLF